MSQVRGSAAPSMNPTVALFVVRLIICVLAIGYLIVMIASHLLPLDPNLEAPLAFTPYLLGLLGGALAFLFGGEAFRQRFRRWLHSTMQRRPDGKLLRFRNTRRPALRYLWYPLPLAIVFATVAVAAFYVAATGPAACPDGSAVCVKTDEWRSSGGQYFRLIPYNAQGQADPNQPWVEISRETYVTEVGTRLRQAATFGVFSLCFAWFVSLAAAPLKSHE
jgi:hypothetical protein